MSPTSRAQRIVVINPNSTRSVTQAIDRSVQPLRFGDGPRIDCLTLPEGPAGIETRRQADAVVEPMCELIVREQPLSDAFVIACFGDPGLHAAREATPVPVFGIAESAYLYALTLGDRFGVIAILPGSVMAQRRYVRQLGLQHRYGASLPVGLGVTAVADGAGAERMEEVGRRLVGEHGVDVLILGCAGMAGHRERLATALAVPVVEPCQAAVALALLSVRQSGG